MVDLTKLRQSYKAARDKAKAHWDGVKAQCETDSRDPTDEERKVFDDAIAEAEGLNASIVTAEADLKRGTWAGDQRQADNATSHRPVPPSQPGQGMGAPELPKIPATAERVKTKHFTASDGFTANEKAYGYGQWIRASQLGDQKAGQWLKGRGVEYDALLQTGVNSAGGSLVPEIFVADLLALQELYGIFRQRAQVVSMSSDTQVWPRLASGQTASWSAEGVARTQSDPSFDMVTLVAKTLTAYSLVSEELMQDSAISVADILAQQGALALATAEDTAGFVGTGLSATGGIVGVKAAVDDGTHTASIDEALAANTAFSTLDLVDFESLLGTLPSFPGMNAAWYISRQGFAASMLRLADAAGGNVKGDLVSGMASAFLGFPVVITQTFPTALTATVSTVLIMLGDLSMSSMLGDRRTLTVSSDAGGKYFEQGVRAFKVEERIAIANHSLGDNTNAGPMIGLKTPAS